MFSFACLLRWLGLVVLLPQFVAAAVVSFEGASPGGWPADWTCAVTGAGEARWTLVPDATAPTPPQVLEQSGVVPKASFPLCLRTTPLLRDGYLEVKFKPVSGTNDQAAGVVWRARDSRNYYVCRANALEDNVVLYKVVDGQRQALDIVGRVGGYGVTAKVAPGQWQTLRVEFVGRRFQVSLAGRELFAVEDGTFTEAGKVGLWTKADSVTRFDDFRFEAK